jgi:CheY-like chemotaxis protein
LIDRDRPIVAVEDEETDRYILNLAFRMAGMPHQLVVLDHGRDCQDYLNGKPPYDDRERHPLPALLLLDLKMPFMDGFEVLAWLASQPELKDIPAVVLSSSSDESDIQRALQLGARGYFVKPLTLPELVKILKDLEAEWLK